MSYSEPDLPDPSEHQSVSGHARSVRRAAEALPAIYWPILLLAVGVLALAGAPGVHAQTPTVELRGRVIDSGTGNGVDGAFVRILDLGRVIQADSTGRFSAHIDRDRIAGAFRLRVWALGYRVASVDSVMEAAGPDPPPIRVQLDPAPVRLRPLTVLGLRGGPVSGDDEPSLFEQTVAPGSMSLKRTELKSIPPAVVPDVLRSLHAVPGVVALNDFAAQLHVRGGASDQNVFRLDGARIFGPYHVFGFFGAINPDAVERVDFYRTALPARYGGGISSVIDIAQRSGSPARSEVDAGFSLLSASVTAAGSAPALDARWMLAARRSHADVIAEAAAVGDFPFSFHDAQGRVDLELGPDHEASVSFFTSADGFRMFLEGADEHLRSDWENHVGSLRWAWTVDESWRASASLWLTRYRGELLAGDGPEAATNDAVSAQGLKVEVERSGPSSGFRVGLDLEAGQLDLAGNDEVGGYLQGSLRGRYSLPSLYAQVERWFGPVRLAPGLRITYDGRDGGSALIEPRVGLRWHLSDDLAATLAAGRSHQVLSTLRDDRMAVPGAPLWFVHPPGEPASRSDQVSLAFDLKPDPGWSIGLDLYARSLDDVVRWRPVGRRDPSSLSFDDGTAVGGEIFVRRRRGALTGWLGYGLSRVRMRSSGAGGDYDAPWDRRHAFDAAGAYRHGALTVSSRITYGSGLPFWPRVGSQPSYRFNPLTGGAWRHSADHFPIFGTEQMRYPDYLRVDLAVRHRFIWGGLTFEPFASVLNVTKHENVLYYAINLDPSRPRGELGESAGPPALVPITSHLFSLLPSVGFELEYAW